MITIATKDENNNRYLRACSIDELEAELDNESNTVNIYYNGKPIGYFIEVYGINEEDFINKIKIREK